MKYLQIFKDMEAFFEPLNNEEKGEVLTAMMAYAFDSTDTEISGNGRYIWPAIRNIIDQSRASYEKQIENGKKGGRPSQQITQTNPPSPQGFEEKPKQTQTNHKQEQEQEQEQEQDQEQEHSPTERENGAHAPVPAPAKKAFVPPTVDEAAAFFEANKGDRNQAEEFINHFEASGWIRNRGVPIKDWRAAARNWIKRDPDFRQRGRASPVKSVPEQQYTQRDYGSSNVIPDDWLTEVAQ